MIDVVACATVNVELDPLNPFFLVRQGFEDVVDRLDAGRYILHLAPLAFTKIPNGIVLVTPTLDNRVHWGTLVDGRFVSVAFNDLAGDPIDSEFHVAVIRVRVGT